MNKSDLTKLVVDYKNNPTDALFKKILSEFSNWISYLSDKYYCFGEDFDDFKQAGMMGLFMSIKNFNPEMPFRPFAMLCIKRNMINLIQSNDNRTNEILNHSARFLQQTNEEDEHVDDLKDVNALEARTVDEKTENINKIKKEFMKLLTPLESRVFLEYIRNQSYAEIRTEIRKKTKREISLRSIDNALERIRRKGRMAAESNILD